MRRGSRLGLWRLAALALGGALAGPLVLGATCDDGCPQDFTPVELPEFVFGLSQVPADAIAIAQEVGASHLRPTLSWRVVEPTVTAQGLTLDAVRNDPAGVAAWSRPLAVALPVYALFLAYPLLIAPRLGRSLGPHLTAVLASFTFFLVARRASRPRMRVSSASRRCGPPAPGSIASSPSCRATRSSSAWRPRSCRAARSTPRSRSQPERRRRSAGSR